MSLVANRYAEGLFSLGLDKNKVEDYKNDLNSVLSVFNDVDNIKTFFISEKVNKSEKKEIIKKAFENKLNKDVLNFLYLLVDKGRIGQYEDIITEYRKMANNELGIKEGIIEVPRPLPNEKIQELEKALSKDSLKVELKQRINKSLISGFKITFDNQVIDASMKDKIDKLYNTLTRKDG